MRAAQADTNPATGKRAAAALQGEAEPAFAGAGAQEAAGDAEPVKVVPAPPAPDSGKAAAAADQIRTAQTVVTDGDTAPTDTGKPDAPRPPPAAAAADAADRPERTQNAVQAAAVAAPQDSAGKRSGASRPSEPTVHDAPVIDDASMPQSGPGGDVRGSASAHVDATRRDLGSTDAPRHVLAQVIDGIRHGRDGRVEVSLSPEELGRLRLTLHGSADGMHVTIQADRPETQDLLRRHIAQLQQDIRALGYSDVSFDFGTRQERPQLPTAAWTVPGTADTEVETVTATAPVTSAAVRMASGRGLDLRL
jgi:flagellar hook-length control protein FliK